jgi:hypothetical protein
MSVIIRIFCWARTPGETFDAVNLAGNGRNECKKVENHHCFIASSFKIIVYDEAQNYSQL